MYVKLFASLYQGTLRGRSDEILVFTNLLAHADQHGIVDKHWRAIAEETGLSKELVEAAIINLEAPDVESRSPEMDGCRIVRMDEHRAWGWKIVNYGKYRAIRNEDDRKEQNRIAQERWRSKHTNKQSKPPSAQAVSSKQKEVPLAQGFARFWVSYPKRKSKGRAEKAWSKLNPNEQHIIEILQAIERAKTSESWQRESGKFIPHPASWLSAKGWEDEDRSMNQPKKVAW